MYDKSIMVITYWSYCDPLVQTYTLPYLRMIRNRVEKEKKIFLITFEQPFYSMSDTEARVVRDSCAKDGVILVSFAYRSPGPVSLVGWIYAVIKLWWLCLLNKVGIVHAWCTPAGALAFLISLLTGKPLIIDSYEPHAEAMVENGTWKQGAISFRILRAFEKMQTKRAMAVIAAAPGMEIYSQKCYGIVPRKIYVKPACVDLEKFSRENRKRTDLLDAFGLRDKVVCVYSGKLGGIYLDKEVFDFWAVASRYWKDMFRVLFLTPMPAHQIAKMAVHSGLDPSIIRIQYVPHHQIPDYLGLGDFAITPVKPISTKRYCSPIKNGEYWAMGLPVVITEGISVDSDIVESENIGAVIKEINEENYLEAIKKIDNLIRNTPAEQLHKKIREVAVRRRNFLIAENIYNDLYGN